MLDERMKKQVAYFCVACYNLLLNNLHIESTIDYHSFKIIIVFILQCLKSTIFTKT
jgi:hypothetical protein